jgi:tetratricopeptide (TPR) repeat protein
MAALQKKNYEVSEAAFRDVLKQKGDMPEAHLNLGISLFHLKSGAEAETELKAALATTGGEKLALGHLYLGQIYIMKKQTADAAAELQKYIDLAPKAPNAEKIKATIADLKKQS